MEQIEFLVEEPSMEAFLRGLLPRVLERVPFEVYPSQCKDELLAKLPERLRGYRKWLPEAWRIIVITDRDQGDCLELKRELEDIASSAGLVTRSRAAGSPYTVINRIAVEELEAWYFGDWTAVREAFPRVSPNIPLQRKYRDPDGIQGGTWETFERILNRAGYFRGGLRKIEAAKKISPYIDPERSSSRSFRTFYLALKELAPGSEALGVGGKGR